MAKRSEFRTGAFSVWPPSIHSGSWRPEFPCRAADLDFELPVALLYARESGLARLRPHLRARGLTEAGWRILRVLESAGRPLTQTEIARYAGGTETNARLAAKRLITRGYAAWQDDPGPGRAVNDWRSGPWLALSDKGRGMIGRVRHLCRISFVDPTPLFPAAQRAALERGLVHLMRTMGASPPVALDPPDPHSGDDDRPGWCAAAVHDLDLGLPLLMKHARAAVLAPLRAILAEQGLTEPQWRILRLLKQRGEPLAKKAVIRQCCFFGPEARHAIGALMRKRLVQFERRPYLTPKGRVRKKQRKRLRIELSRDGRIAIECVEDMEYAQLAPAMLQVSAGGALALHQLLGEQGRAWMWRPGVDLEAMEFHPLADTYARQDASARASALVINAQRRAAAWARMGWLAPEPGRPPRPLPERGDPWVEIAAKRLLGRL